MRINELFLPLLEHRGAKSFGGFGRGDFQQRHFQALAQWVHDEPPAVQGAILDWLVPVLRKENPGFKPDRFRRAAEKGGYDTRVTFQARHFFFLAEMIKSIEDVEMRTYIARELGKFFERLTSSNFRSDRWDEYIGIDLDR